MEEGRQESTETQSNLQATIWESVESTEKTESEMIGNNCRLC